MGGVVSAVSVFLTWYSLDLASGSKTISAWSTWSGITVDFGGSEGSMVLESIDPLIVLILGLVTAALAVAALVSRNRLAYLLVLVAGLAVVGIGFRDWTSTVDATIKGVDVSQGAGLIMAFIGGGIAALGGLWGLVSPTKK